MLVENDALGSAGVYFRPGKIIQAARISASGVRAFEVTADYRSELRAGRPHPDQTIRRVALRLADMATRIEAVRALLGRAAQAVDDKTAGCAE